MPATIRMRSCATMSYVGLVGDELVGYYTLAFGAVEHAATPERIGKGLARHPIPLMVLARLAVSNAWHGQGVGSAMLKDAVLRTLQAAEIAGLRALAVHAKDDEARAFYERCGFIPSPSDPYHLLYRLIARLTDAGLIAPARLRRAADDPRRRYYRITPLGREVAAREAGRLAGVVKLARSLRLLEGTP